MERIKGLVDSMLGKAKKYVNVKEAYGKAKQVLSSIRKSPGVPTLKKYRKELSGQITELRRLLESKELHGNTEKRKELIQAIDKQRIMLQRKYKKISNLIEKLETRSVSKKEIFVVGALLASSIGVVYTLIKALKGESELQSESDSFDILEFSLLDASKDKIQKLVSKIGLSKVYSALRKVDNKVDSIIGRLYGKYSRFNTKELMKVRSELVKSLEKEKSINNTSGVKYIQRALKGVDRLLAKQTATNLTKVALILAIASAAIKVYKSKNKEQEG